MNEEIEKSSSQITSFHVKSIHMEKMHKCDLLIFYNIGEYFLLQRGYEFDEQEDNLGFNTYYIEYCDQSQSCYGGIDTIQLYIDRVDIKLNDDAAKKLKTNKQISILFNIEENKYENLKTQLQNIFLREI